VESGGNNKEEITNEEACEVLKFIQQSDYKVVDQLNQIPARILLMELLTHSPSHKKLLMKILSGAHADKDITLDKFEGIVSHITPTIISPLVRKKYLQKEEDTIKHFISPSNAWTI